MPKKPTSVARTQFPPSGSRKNAIRPSSKDAQPPARYLHFDKSREVDSLLDQAERARSCLVAGSASLRKALETRLRQARKDLGRNPRPQGIPRNRARDGWRHPCHKCPPDGTRLRAPRRRARGPGDSRLRAQGLRNGPRGARRLCGGARARAARHHPGARGCLHGRRAQRERRRVDCEKSHARAWLRTARAAGLLCRPDGPAAPLLRRLRLAACRGRARHRGARRGREVHAPPR